MHKVFKNYSSNQKTMNVNSMADSQGIIHTSHDKIVSILTDTWKNLCKKHSNAPNAPAENAYAGNYEIKNISKDTICRELKNLKPEKSPGLDEILADFIRDASPALVDILHNIFNKINSTRRIIRSRI